MKNKKPMTILLKGDEFVAFNAFPYIGELRPRGWIFDGGSKTWSRPADSYIAGASFEEFMTPAAKDRLSHLKEVYDTAIAKSMAVESDLSIPVPPDKALMPFQRAGVEYLRDHPAAILGDDMGLGKTIQVVALTNLLTAIDTVLVVCPSSLKLNWQREFQTWSTRRLTTEVVHTGKQDISGVQVVIISFDLLRKHQELAEWKWGLVVYDEAHFLKHRSTQRATAAFGLSEQAASKRLAAKHKLIDPLEFFQDGKDRQEAITKRIAADPKLVDELQSMVRLGVQGDRMLFLTGTPMPNRPIELWTILQQVDPKGLGLNYYAYAQRYCDARQTGYGGMDTKGASHLEELQARLRSTCLVRRMKEDVLADLPEMTPQLIEIEATGNLASLVAKEVRLDCELEKVRKEIARLNAAKPEGRNDTFDTEVAGLRASQSIAFETMSKLRHELAVAKIPAIIEHVQTILDDCQKLVVMAHHKDVIDALREEFPDAAVLIGGMQDTTKQDAIDRFQNDLKCRLFIGSIQAAGVGITLTAARTIVFAEQDWVPGTMKQAIDRLHRIGQKNAVLAQILVVDGSLDAKMATTLLQKEAVIAKALDAPIPQIVPIPAPQPSKPSAKSDADLASSEPSIMPDAQRAAIHACLRLLAAKDPDRAREANGEGFNRFDGDLGHSLADQGTLSTEESERGLAIVRKYPRQIPPDLFAVATRTTPTNSQAASETQPSPKAEGICDWVVQRAPHPSGVRGDCASPASSKAQKRPAENLRRQGGPLRHRACSQVYPGLQSSGRKTDAATAIAGGGAGFGFIHDRARVERPHACDKRSN